MQSFANYIVYFHPVSKWERVVALQGFKLKYQNP